MRTAVRLWLLFPIVAASIALSSVGALAGGASVEWDDVTVTPGQQVTGREAFSANIQGLGRPADGPWDAYFIPRGSDVTSSDDPVAPVQIRRAEGQSEVAVITFTVPNVPPGKYVIDVCTPGCKETQLGDLWPSFNAFTVSGSSATAAAATTQVIKGKLADARRDARSWRQRARAADDRLAEIKDRLRSSQQADPAATIEPVQAPPQVKGEPTPVLSIVVALVLGVFAGALATMAFSRRRMHRGRGVQPAATAR